MQPVRSAVIAAAGMGSRLGLGIPKCMLEVNGRTLLSRQIDILERHVEHIHVVVGYREEMILEHCSRHHRKVVLVRNRDFRTTNTAYSYKLGAAALPGKVLYIDGDIIVDETSLVNFLQIAANCDVLVGLTAASSENAVFAHCTSIKHGDSMTVGSFSRSVPSDYEWANIVTGPNSLMQNADGFVFEQLAARLPLPAATLNMAEVDTPLDLERAHKFAFELNA